MLAADALEEHRKVEPVPGETRIDAVMVARPRVADHAQVAGVVGGVVAVVDRTAVVQVGIDEVAGL